jgi:hypothetical protein
VTLLASLCRVALVVLTEGRVTHDEAKRVSVTILLRDTEAEASRLEAARAARKELASDN